MPAARNIFQWVSFRLFSAVPTLFYIHYLPDFSQRYRLTFSQQCTKVQLLFNIQSGFIQLSLSFC